MKSGGSLSIWFFIGLSLAVNGVVICATGIYELISPPANQVVLYDLHANVWWGAVLLILGLFFCVRHSPAKERARLAGNS
jgi:hypothetical protein